jgi:hypothetical protein
MVKSPDQLPFVPEKWPTEEEFQTAFKRAAERARERREHPNEDDLPLRNQYRDRRPGSVRLTSAIGRLVTINIA